MKFGLIYQLVQRGISERYKGSTLGFLWSFVTPILMLSIYTFIFGVVFQSRWTSTSETPASTGEFAIILFTGLSVYQWVADSISQAPTLITQNRVFVTKVQFPIEILSIVSVVTSLFHYLISLLVLLVASVFIYGHIEPSVIAVPFVLVPLFIMLLGFSWGISFLGVYFKDIIQLVGPTLTALMFLSPIFFPISALPSWIEKFIYFNPLTLPIEELRKCIVFGEFPAFLTLGIYFLFSISVLLLGYYGFYKTKKGFADVL